MSLASHFMPTVMSRYRFEVDEDAEEMAMIPVADLLDHSDSDSNVHISFDEPSGMDNCQDGSPVTCANTRVRTALPAYLDV